MKHITAQNHSQSGQQRNRRHGRGMARTRPWMPKFLASGLPRAVAMVVGVACLISLGSCRSRIADPEMPEWDDASIEAVLKKPNLKVLDIGNSYTNDATALLPTVVKNSGVDVKDMCLYRIVRGGASFKKWCGIYEDSDTQPYSFQKVIGGIDVGIPSQTAEAGDGTLFREVLSEVEWDLIIIHQLSNYAPYYDLWNGDGAGGGLDKLLGIIRQNQPNAMIGFLLVHSYWDNYSGNEEKSSLKRWQKIVSSVEKLQKEYYIPFIIPYGTAIENLRSTSLNNSYDLTRDGLHLGFGLGQYTAACCYFESLIAPRTGVSCYGITTRIDVSDMESNYPAVSVTKKNALIAQKAAVLAVKDKYHYNNPETKRY